MSEAWYLQTGEKGIKATPCRRNLVTDGRTLKSIFVWLRFRSTSDAKPVNPGGRRAREHRQELWQAAGTNQRQNRPKQLSSLTSVLIKSTEEHRFSTQEDLWVTRWNKSMWGDIVKCYKRVGPSAGQNAAVTFQTGKVHTFPILGNPVLTHQNTWDQYWSFKPHQLLKDTKWHFKNTYILQRQILKEPLQVMVWCWTRAVCVWALKKQK